VTRTIGAILIALAVAAGILAVWWDDHRYESLITAALLFIVGEDLLDTTKKKDDQ
jgi:hypothetical protein